MKGKKFYVALIGLFMIGIGSIYLYRQQEEARALEFEGYEISSIESRVDALYNAEKTDIQEDIEPEFKELEEVFDELRTKNLRYRNQKQVEELEKQFLTAKQMHELQIDIEDIFKEDDIVHNNTSLDEIEALETSLTPFEDKTVYYKRNSNYISDARVQLETLEEATKRVEKLTTDGMPNEDVDEEELKKLEELVAQIKDEETKEHLLEQISSVRAALAEMEKEVEVASEETEETEEIIEEELEVEEALVEEVEEEPGEATEEVIEEEVVEEESVETVQETAQATEQPNNSTPPTNDSESSAQQASSNNNRTNTSQTNRSSSNSSTSGSSSNQPSKPAKQQTNQQTNKQTDKQTNKQENNQQESKQSKEENKNEESKNEESKNEESKKEENKKEENKNEESNSSNQEPKEAEKRPAVDRKYTEKNVEDTTPFETKTYKNANIAAGEEIVYQEGRPGQVIKTYEITVYKNGTSSKRLISKEETEPENRVVTVGTKEPETESE